MYAVSFRRIWRSTNAAATYTVVVDGKEACDLTSIDRPSQMIEMTEGVHMITVYVKSYKKINVCFEIDVNRNTQIDIDTSARFSVRLQPISIGSAIISKNHNVSL